MPAGILGARGFIGSYLCGYLAAQELGPLRLLIRSPGAIPALPAAEILHGDLLSRADCERFASGLDVIYYLAHTHTPVDSDLDQPNDAAVNLMPLLNLLEAIRRLGGKPHLVYFSSGGAVYTPRPAGPPYRESDPCSPVSSYGILKLTAEQYLRLASDRGELTATVLRLGNAYGTLLPDYRLQGLIGVALNLLLLNRPVRIFGNAGNVRDYVHMEDVCAMVRQVSTPRRPFDIVNVGSGQGHSVIDILGIIRDCHGKDFPIQTDPAHGQWLANWVILDNSRARQEYGWSPTIGLHAGIAAMLAVWTGEARAESAFRR